MQFPGANETKKFSYSFQQVSEIAPIVISTALWALLIHNF